MDRKARIFLISGIAAGWGVSGVAAGAADMSARDVTRVLFAARPDKPTDLSRKDLSGLDLSALDFKRAHLDGCNLRGADLSASNLAGASLRNAKLDRATLIGADFSSADLTGVSILRPNVFSSLNSAQGRPHLTFAGARLAGANLNGNFDLIDFTGADLSGTFFGPRDPREEVLITPMMSLNGANFTSSNLTGADLALNDLENAKFNGANMSRANLRGARLGAADFTGANVDGADFTGARLEGALLSHALGKSTAIGLAGASQGGN